MDGVGVIVLDVFRGFLKVDGCDVCSAFGGLFLHNRKHQKEASGGGQVVSVVFGEGGEEVLHVCVEGLFLFRVFRSEDAGGGEYGLFQDFFAGCPVKACPGIAPGFVIVSAVIDGVHGADEEGIACFQMIGMAAALVDAFAVGDYVEKVVGAHGRAEGVAGAAVLLAAEVDGEGVLGVGFFFHLFWDPPVFLSVCSKNVILGHKRGVIVVWGDYTIWG